MSPVHFENNSFSSLVTFLQSNHYSSLYVLVDENTLLHCYPKVVSVLPPHQVIEIKSGEESKNLSTCELVWSKLTEANADRKTLLVNLGGGVIGDLGGFAAGCYKRGIAFINLPTTLLAMVDASVGAKCGIDFLGYKNQIGLFNEPEAVFIHTGFLETLPGREVWSGFAEVLKHYLIADKEAFLEIRNQKSEIRNFNFDELVKKNVAIKQQIVEQDPTEQGIRKALNFGHTIGHAVESYFMKKEKLLHGEAIAVGMICECFVSYYSGLLPQHELVASVGFLSAYFKTPHIPANDFSEIISLLTQDKKNVGGAAMFTLLNGIGSFSINQTVPEQVIIRSLEYYNFMAE